MLRLKTTKFNNIFIVEDRNFWPICSISCNKETDLVLCIDFALKKQLLENGYNVEFLDHLADSESLEKLNFETHNFLNEWYKDSDGKNLLNYNGYNIGDSLLLYLINDVIFFCHYFFNIIQLKELQYNNLILVAKDETIIDCLKKATIPFDFINEQNINSNKSVYYFPIIKWVNEKVTPTLRFRIKNIIANFFDIYFKFSDLLRKRTKDAVYIQNYYPTNSIIQELETDNTIQIVLPNYLGLNKLGHHRRVHYQSNIISKKIVNGMIKNYQDKRIFEWNVFSYPMAEFLKDMIDDVLNRHLSDALNKAENIERWMKQANLKLMIPITNLWTSNRLIMQFCFKNKIPVYTIINGQLNVSYYHDAKDSDFVNSYSDSIKENYFGNKINVFPLGDPRMDKYAGVKIKKINRNSPTIIIGAAGYDSIDLNSYLAYEFDFLYDILFCINENIKKGYEANVVLKVRGNGYVSLYSHFIEEYFYHLNVKIVQDKSFFEIISEADLYISIFSQTIFEASCFGIPVIYYKKDTQVIHEPFDGKSELVTANNISELQEKIDLFYNGSDVFDAFMQKSVLEKYIGPLNGKNTQRNIDFIMDLVEGNHKKI
jgi:hypothetical protein